MSRINVPPTRSNLLHMKQELQFAREGFEILDRKREVLSTELVHIAHDAEVLQEQVWKLLAAAYEALEQAKLTMGREHVEWAALAVNKTVDVRLVFATNKDLKAMVADGALREGEHGEDSAGLRDSRLPRPRLRRDERAPGGHRRVHLRRPAGAAEPRWPAALLGPDEPGTAARKNGARISARSTFATTPSPRIGTGS